MEEKYVLTKDVIIFNGATLRPIMAVRDLTTIDGTKVKAGDIGGAVEGCYNLENDSKSLSWIKQGAYVWGARTKVTGNALVGEQARVYSLLGSDGVIVRDEAQITGNVDLCGDGAVIGGYAKIHGSVTIEGKLVMSHHTEVYGDARLEGCITMDDYASIHGKAEIYALTTVRMRGHARVYGEAEIRGGGSIRDNVRVHEKAYIKSNDFALRDEAEIGGSTEIYGPVIIEGRSFVSGGKRNEVCISGGACITGMAHVVWKKDFRFVETLDYKMTCFKVINEFGKTDLWAVYERFGRTSESMPINKLRRRHRFLRPEIEAAVATMLP